MQSTPAALMRQSSLPIIGTLLIAVCLFAGNAAAQTSDPLAEAKKHMPGASEFGVNSVKAYVEDIAKLKADLESVGTPQQATEFARKFRADFPRLASNQKLFRDSLLHYGIASQNNTKGPGMAMAEALLKRLETQGPAIDAAMLKLEKLNPSLAPDFQAWRDLHDSKLQSKDVKQ